MNFAEKIYYLLVNFDLTLSDFNGVHEWPIIFGLFKLKKSIDFSYEKLIIELHYLLFNRYELRMPMWMRLPFLRGMRFPGV